LFVEGGLRALLTFCANKKNIVSSQKVTMEKSNNCSSEEKKANFKKFAEALSQYNLDGRDVSSSLHATNGSGKHYEKFVEDSKKPEDKTIK
jgi:hypothetical protein